MYVQELAEIEAVLKQQKSSEQAAQYNQMSFVFAGFGLVMLLFHPFAGLVLLIVGLVFSALYYTKKGTIGNAEVTPVGTVRDPSTRTKTSKSRVTTAILAVLLGSLGVHFFYLKAWGWGFICIFLFWTYIPTIAGIILGIRYLTMSDKDFERRAKKVQGAFGPIEI
jgi:TM2 domain-containing membrane protein YozV